MGRNPRSPTAFSTWDALDTNISAEEVSVPRGPDPILSQEQITEGPTLSGSFLIASNSTSPQRLSRNDRWHVHLSWSIFLCLSWHFEKNLRPALTLSKSSPRAVTRIKGKKPCPWSLQTYKRYIFTNHGFIFYFSKCKDGGAQVNGPKDPRTWKRTRHHKGIAQEGRVSSEQALRPGAPNHKQARSRCFCPSSMATSRAAPPLAKVNMLQNLRASSLILWGIPASPD